MTDRRDPHWLLRDRKLLEEVKRLASRYEPSIPPGTPVAMDYEATYEHDDFRFAAAGSSLSAPTWLASQGGVLDLNEDGQGDYALQVWFAIAQTEANATLGLTEGFKLQYKLNSGGTWTDVGTTTTDPVYMVADAGFADGDPISSAQVTGLPATYVAGEGAESDGTTGTITFTTEATSYTNLAFSVEINDDHASVTDGLNLYFRVVEDDGTVLSGSDPAFCFINWDAPPPIWTLDGFRIYAAPGTESGSTPLSAEDEVIGIEPGRPFHVRVAIRNTGGSTGDASAKWTCSINGGSYANVGVAGSGVDLYDDSNLTNDSSTTDRAANGIANASGSFQAGQVLDTSAASILATPSLTVGNYTEHLISVQIDAAEVSHGDIITFSPLGGETGSPSPEVRVHKPDQVKTIPPKPSYQMLPIRKDGIWRGIHRIFGTLYGAPLTELTTGRIGDNSQGAFTINDGADTLFSPTLKDAGPGGRVVWELDPSGENKLTGDRTEGVWPTYGITVAALVFIDSPTQTSSTSIIQRYNGTSGAYPWRILFPSGDNSTDFGANLDGNLRTCTTSVTIPRAEWVWLIGRWASGEQLRYNIYRLNGVPIGSDSTTVGSYDQLTYDEGDAAPPDDHYDALWGDSNSAIDGYGAAAFIWDRKLESEELLRFFSNPWDFYDNLDLVGGVVPYTGAGAGTLAVATGSATGTYADATYSGDGAGTLAPATSTATGTYTDPTWTGDGAGTLQPATSAATGSYSGPAYSGTGAGTLAVATAAATGTFTNPTYTGAGAGTLAPATSTATGTYADPTYTGTGSGTLAPATASGTGTLSVTYFGAGAGTATPATGAATGTFTAPTYTGAGAGTATPATGVATGTFTAPVYTGAGAGTATPATASGTGTYADPTYTGTGSGTLVPATASGTGTLSVTFAGTGAGTATPATGAATGTYADPTYTGTGAGTLVPAVSTASGTYADPTYAGDGAGSLTAATGTASGTYSEPVWNGDGVGTLATATGAATGTFAGPTYSGDGAGTLAVVSSSATGTYSDPAYSGTGAGTATPATGTATGTYVEPVAALDGWRWYNDDAGEAASTPATNEDSALVMSPNGKARLRVQIAHPTAGQYGLQYRKVGSADWSDVP